MREDRTRQELESAIYQLLVAVLTHDQAVMSRLKRLEYVNDNRPIITLSDNQGERYRITVAVEDLRA